MENTNAWKAPGRPWGLQLLTLIVVIGGVVAPIYYGLIEDVPLELEGVSAEELSFMKTRAEQQSGKVLIWAGAALFGFIGILIVASSSIDAVSPPFPYLFAPLIFSLLLYFGLLSYGKINPTNLPWLTGSIVQTTLVVVVSLTLTALLARLQMSIIKKKLSHVEWEIVKPSKFSGTYFSELAALFHPLVYPPRRYSACSEGILIEGLFFVMPLPFRSIQHIARPPAGKGVASTGIPLATSTEEMIRIQTTETRKPLFISPVDRDEFYEYIDPHITRHKLTLESEKEDKTVKATPAKKDYKDRPMPKKSATPMHADDEDGEEHTMLMDIMSSNLGLESEEEEVPAAKVEDEEKAAGLEKTIAVEPQEPEPPPEPDDKGILSDLTEEEIEKAAQENDPFADIVTTEDEKAGGDDDFLADIDKEIAEEADDDEDDVGGTSDDEDIFGDDEEKTAEPKEKESPKPKPKPKPVVEEESGPDDDADDLFGDVSDDDFSTVVMTEDDEPELEETIARESANEEEEAAPIANEAPPKAPAREEPAAEEETDLGELEDYDTTVLDTAMEDLDALSPEDTEALLDGLDDVPDVSALDELIGSDPDDKKE